MSDNPGRPWFLRSVIFAEKNASITLAATPLTVEEKYPPTLTFAVTVEHGRALTQYIGEECQIFALPTCTTFDNVTSFKKRAAP